MNTQPLPNDDDVTASVARVRHDVINKLRRPHRRRGLIWSSIGIGILVFFGGGVAAGAAFANTGPIGASVPAGTLKIDCYANGSTVPEQSQYFNTKAPGTLGQLAAAMQANPAQACIASTQSQLVEKYGQAIETRLKAGPGCGALTIPGEPTMYYSGDITGSGTRTAHGSFNKDAITWGPSCITENLPTPTQPLGNLIACTVSANTIAVYAETNANDPSATCKTHGGTSYRP